MGSGEDALSECSSSRSKTRRLSDQFWSTLRLERGLSTVGVWTSFRFEALTILVFARWKLPCWPFPDPDPSRRQADPLLRTLSVQSHALARRGVGRLALFGLVLYSDSRVAPPVSGCAPVHPVEPGFCGEVPSPPDAFCADATRDDASNIAVINMIVRIVISHAR